MLSFSKLFYQPMTNELNAEEKAKQHEKLRDIYEGEPSLYQDKSDFQLCKNQLIKLLNYLNQLNPIKLKIFATYKERVESLTETMLEADIIVTLRTTKNHLENTLYFVELNHSRVDATLLNDYIVDKCYPGAYANIARAIGHFQLDSFHALVAYAKRTVLMDLAGRFVNEKKLVEFENAEIHMVSGLFNFVAPSWGEYLIDDPFATEHDETILNSFKVYVDKKFGIRSFLNTLTLLLPEQEIRTREEYRELTNFFQGLGEKGADKEKYLQLYDEYEEEDVCFLKPRAAFKHFHTCLLLNYLNSAGFINGFSAKIGDKHLLDADDIILQSDTNGRYQLLEDSEILLLLGHVPQDIFYQRLLLQITEETLLANCWSASTQQLRVDCFRTLLKKPHLSPITIQQLYRLVNDDILSKHRIAEYVFQREYEKDLSDLLARELPEAKLSHYMRVATQNNWVNHVQSLWLVKPLPSPKDGNFSPFHLAAAHNAVEVFLFFHNQYKNVGLLNYKDPQDLTPAHHAAENGNVGVLATLHQLGAKLDVPDHMGITPSHLAARTGSIDVLNFLHLNNYRLDLVNNDGNTLAHLAALNNHSEVIKLLDNFGYPIDQPNNEGDRPIHFAVEKDYENIFSLLVELKCPLNSANKAGKTLAQLAVENGNLSIIKSLHTHHVSLNEVDAEGNSLVHLAALYDVEMLNLLYSFGCPLDSFNLQGITPAHIAAEEENLDFLLRLHELNVSLNATSLAKVTPIEILAKNGQYEILETLKEAGVPLDSKNLVHLAAKSDHVDLLFKLHEWGVPIDEPNEDGNTPAHLAVEKDNPSFILQLYEFNVKFDKLNKDGHTAIHLSARCKDETMIKTFKDLGFDINQPNAKGMTPALLAAQIGRLSIIKELSYISTSYTGKCELKGVDYLEFLNDCYDSRHQIKKIKKQINREAVYQVSPKFVAYIQGFEEIVEFLEEQERTETPGSPHQLGFFSAEKNPPQQGLTPSPKAEL